MMIDIQIFAFILLPIAIAVGGWIIAFIVHPPKGEIAKKSEQAVTVQHSAIRPHGG